MNEVNWQPRRWPPYQHVFFDCDSTLTRVEGIDILAAAAGKGWRVEVLTQAAMDGDVELAEVYGKRLQAVKPTRQQVRQIRQVYKRNVVEDAAVLIEVLQQLGHHVYIISGGLAEPVVEFGLSLGVPRSHIRGVDLRYDELAGAWWRPLDDADEARYVTHDGGALTDSAGKADIVRELLAGRRGRSLLVGDGSSDLQAAEAVDLFVGYGGVVRRPRVADEAPVFVHSASLAPLLALAAGPMALRRLTRADNAAGSTDTHRQLAQKAASLIQTGAITFQNERLKAKFQGAFGAPYSPVYSRTD